VILVLGFGCLQMDLYSMVCIEVQEGISRTFDTKKVDCSCLWTDLLCNNVLLVDLFFLAKSLKGQGIYWIKGEEP